MATTQQRQKQLDRKANRSGVLSERQARARHAQIARNYFSQKPSISNLYNGAINYLQSKGIITPEGTGLVTGVAPAAGIGNVGAAGRVAATTRSVSGGRGWTSTRGWSRTNSTWRQAKPTASRSTPKTNKKTYTAPSAGRPNVPTTTSEGIQNRLRPQSRTVPTLPNSVTNRLQYHNQQMARGNVHLGNGIYGAPARRALPAPKQPSNIITIGRSAQGGQRTVNNESTQNPINNVAFSWRKAAREAGIGAIAGAIYVAIAKGLSNNSESNKDNTSNRQSANARRKAQQEAAKEKEKSSAGTTQVVATSGGATVAPKAQQEAAKEKEKSSAGTTQVVATSGGATVAPKAQQEAAKEKEKSSAGTTQVVATSGGATVAPKAPRTSGGRTTSGRTVPRRRRYLDSTPAVSTSTNRRNRRQRKAIAAQSVAPQLSREEVIGLYGGTPNVAAVAPNVATTSADVRAAVNEILRSEDYDDLYKLRQQYKRGGKVRC